MINQQLIDYINQSMQQGVSQEQIKSALITNNWQEQDIEEGFNSINTSTQSWQYSNSSAKELIKIWKIISIFVVGALLIGGGVYFASQNFFKPMPKQELTNKQPQQVQAEITSAIPEQETLMEVIIIDCKQDLRCLIQASETCKPAKVTYTATVDIFGVKQTTTSFFEIKGIEINKCNFYLRTEKIDLEFPPNIPQEVVNKQKEIYKKLEGRYGTCRYNTSDLMAMLARWENGNLESGDFGVAECQGTYFEPLSL